MTLPVRSPAIDNTQKIQIAKDYVAKYKHHDPDLWMMNEYTFGDTKLLSIYNHLMEGTFGSVRCLDEELDEDGEVIKYGSEYEIEISSRDSLDGAPIQFTWHNDEFACLNA